jgi:antitoxin (DNA-binding transcriptional repressor) of toxin-antitoxin stability system
MFSANVERLGMKIVNVTDFKAKCLAMFDEIATTGESIRIIKHGKAIAEIFPAVETEKGYPQDSLKGTVQILADIVSPVLAAEDWNAEGGEC